MPVYDYECGQCGERFETSRGIFHRNSKVKCPKCGATDARKVFSPISRASSPNCPPPAWSSG